MVIQVLQPEPSAKTKINILKMLESNTENTIIVLEYFLYISERDK